MKVIFLDFHGVLSSEQSILYYTRRGVVPLEEMCPIACSNFQLILDHVPDLKVVISSTLRLTHSVEELKSMLRVNGIDAKRVIGACPKDTPRDERLYDSKAAVIYDWIAYSIKRDMGVTNFLILDDSKEMKPLEAKHLWISAEHGLTLRDAKKAVEKLTGHPFVTKPLWKTV